MDMMTFGEVADSCKRIEAAQVITDTQSRASATNSGFVGPKSNAVKAFLQPFMKLLGKKAGMGVGKAAELRASARVVEVGDVSQLAAVMAGNHKGLM
jgi:hypothetical protein